MVREVKAKVLGAVLALVLAPAGILSAATGTVMPSPKFYCFDNNGVIASGAKLFTYDAGTTTKRATYSDAALTSANANPVVCDSSGRATVFLTPGISYKFTLAPSTDTDPPAAAYWTVDSISTVPFGTTDLDVMGTAGEALTAGNALYLSDGAGGCGATAGRYYKTDADLTCASTTAQAIGFAVADIASAASGSIRIQGKVTGLSGLAAGTVYYISATAGAITSSAPTNQRAVGVADSGTTLVISSALTAAPASATQAGIVSLGAQQLGTGVKTLPVQPLWITGGAASIAVPGLLTSDNTDRAVSVAGLADSGWSYAMPGATLAVGRRLRITVFGIIAATGANTTRACVLVFGGTSIRGFNTSTAGGDSWRAVFEIVATGAATQRAIGHGFYNSSTVLDAIEYQTPAETISGAITIKTQLNPGESVAMTQKSVYIEIW